MNQKSKIERNNDKEPKTKLFSINAFFERKQKLFLIISMVLAAIMSILLFDTKVSLSGDDCDYIISADNFWKHFTFPGHHGSLYPIIISPLVGIFGIKLIPLKILSSIFMVSSIWFLYKAFQNKIPYIVLIPSLILVCLNPHVFFFASYTYSEPLFLLMEALYFYFFSKYFWTDEKREYNIKTDWKKYLVLAIIAMGVGLTRTIGFCIIGVVILYFIFKRQWKDLIYTFGSFAIIFAIFYFLKPIIWPNSASVQSFETLLAKNPYNPELGAENINGLMARFWENSNIYISWFLYKYFGFRSSSDDPLKYIPALSIITYIAFFICLIAVFKKNKALLFSGLYVGILNFASFILLHKLWAQDRMIMVYYPYILIFLLGGFYYLFTSSIFKKISILYLIIPFSLFVGTLIHAKERIALNIPILQQNMLGNDLYGLTPDWENFIKMCRWADSNIAKNEVIVSRKPSMSLVYTGREFAGIYSVPNETIDNLINQFQNEKDKFVFIVSESPIKELQPTLEYIFISKRESKIDKVLNGKKINAVAVYKLDKSLLTEEFINYLTANNINYTSDYETFLKPYINDKELGYQIFSPDVLLKNINDMHVKYLLLPRIRVYTPENTGMYINTIHQYISYIQMKYPNSFKIIKSIGGNTEQEKRMNEACELAEFIGQ